MCFIRRPTVYNEIQYKTLRTKVTKDIKVARRSYFRISLANCQNDLKQTWRIIKEALSLPPRQPLPGSFEIDGNLVTDESSIANQFNDYFVGVGANLAASLPNSQVHHDIFLRNSPASSMFLSPVTPQEVVDCISLLKEGSPGHNEIAPKVVKSSKNLLAAPLSHIYILTFLKGEVPSYFKVAHITPVILYLKLGTGILLGIIVQYRFYQPSLRSLQK